MDKTMSEQFRKVHERKKGHKRFGSSGDWCKIRASLDENKLNQRHRTCLYEEPTSSVPTMLLGNLNSSPSRSRPSSKAGDDRFRCLLSDSR